MALCTDQLGVLCRIPNLYVCVYPRVCTCVLFTQPVCISCQLFVSLYPREHWKWSSTAQLITITCCLVASHIHMQIYVKCSSLYTTQAQSSCNKQCLCASVIFGVYDFYVYIYTHKLLLQTACSLLSSLQCTASHFRAHCPMRNNSPDVHLSHAAHSRPFFPVKSKHAPFLVMGTPCGCSWSKATGKQLLISKTSLIISQSNLK